jgi:hypothetical protein
MARLLLVAVLPLFLYGAMEPLGMLVNLKG